MPRTRSDSFSLTHIRSALVHRFTRQVQAVSASPELHSAGVEETARRGSVSSPEFLKEAIVEALLKIEDRGVQVFSQVSL